MRDRSNEQWLNDLRSTGPEQAPALEDLREALRRSALFYLRRHRAELSELAEDEIEALAEDSAQEATVSVLGKLEAFRGEAKFLTWASKFGVGSALSSLRKRQWRDLSLDRLPYGWEEPAATVISRDGWDHPDMAAERNQTWEVIREVVMSDLTQKQREVLNYVVIHGVSAEVVAARLGMSAGALYKMTHDARRKLKAALEKRGFMRDEVLSAFANPG